MFSSFLKLAIADVLQLSIIMAGGGTVKANSVFVTLIVSVCVVT